MDKFNIHLMDKWMLKSYAVKKISEIVEKTPVDFFFIFGIL